MFWNRLSKAEELGRNYHWSEQLGDICPSRSVGLSLLRIPTLYRKQQ